LLLPPMKADLHWTFAQAEALNTNIGVGYLIGALAFPLIARHVSANRLFLAGCVSTSACMVPAIIHGFSALLARRPVACSAPSTSSAAAFWRRDWRHRTRAAFGPRARPVLWPRRAGHCSIRLDSPGHAGRQWLWLAGIG